MGNSSTKEQRHPESSSSTHTHVSSSRHQASVALSGAPGPSTQPYHNDRFAPPSYSSRSERSGRPDIGLFGIGRGSDRDTAGLEGRKETKQERDARRAERDRVAREKDRERSVREEGVDGGFLVTLGVYTGIEDFNKAVVRQLMIERRLAPFWRGLNELSGSWREHQLVAAVRGQPIPAAEDIPPDPPSRASGIPPSNPRSSEPNLNNLTVPISSRSQSYGSDNSSNIAPSHPTSSIPSPTSPVNPSSTSSSSPFRPRSKTLASLTTLSKNSSAHGDMTPREVQLPKDPYVDGRPIEALLYENASECPICFLYYPRYLNKTRCCDQPICSECFVQIKRPDPHPPEHADPTLPLPAAGSENHEQAEGTLISEPAACPFCVQPEFGITYESPSFRRGLVYANNTSGPGLANATSAMSSSSSISSSTGNGIGGLLSSGGGNRRRTTSLSATAPSVITTDKIRPDWAQKLSNARAHAARRSAAATALHTAAYLMGGGGESRGLGAFRRRATPIRGQTVGGESPGSGSRTPHGDHRITLGNMSALATLAGVDRQGSSSGRSQPNWTGQPNAEDSDAPSQRRRSRMDDLEEMMMMEAIRLSLAAEEERKKKEDKEAKKEARKREKENKKAEKAAKKGLTSGSSVELNPSLRDGNTSGGSSISEAPFSQDKGKEVDRTATVKTKESFHNNPAEPALPPKAGLSDTQTPPVAIVPSPEAHLQLSRARLQPSDAASPPNSGTGPSRPSHLRQVSNTSTASSVIDSPVGSFKNVYPGSASSFDGSANTSELNVNQSAAQESNLSPTTVAGGAGTEPMFNFNSLAAMIGEEGSFESTHPQHLPRRISNDNDTKTETTAGLAPVEEAPSNTIDELAHDPASQDGSSWSQEPLDSSRLGPLPFETESAADDDAKSLSDYHVTHEDPPLQTLS
ncbi:MAG: SNF1-interacting protein [Sclerophora amabilis]|nr:MAG: SNF1-interacting protein [Sclerophora amabilis]